MHSTRNCKKKAAMQDRSNLLPIRSKDVGVLQDVAFQESADSCSVRKRNVGKHCSKENQVPQSKLVAKPKCVSKNHNSMSSVSERVKIRKELPISKKNTKSQKSNMTNIDSFESEINAGPRSSVLKSSHNLDNSRNKSFLKSKMIYNTALKATNENKENGSNKSKYKNKAPPISLKENSVMRRFPKWVSKTITSFKGNKKRSCNSDIYSIDQDEDLMMEEATVKRVVVKKAKITKTKKIAVKQNSNSVIQKKKKVQLKKAQSGKKIDVVNLPINSDSMISDKMVQATKSNTDVLKKSANNLKETESPYTHVDLHLNCVVKEADLLQLSCTENIINKLSKETKNVPLKQINASDKQKNLSVTKDVCESNKTLYLVGKNDFGKSAVIQGTPEKHVHQIELSRLAVFNGQSFPEPQMTSTPENGDSPRINPQVVCGNSFDARLLEIPHIVSQDVQWDIYDTKLFSPEKESSDAVGIELFKTPVKEAKKKESEENTSPNQSSVVLKRSNVPLKPKIRKDKSLQSETNTNYPVVAELPVEMAITQNKRKKPSKNQKQISNIIERPKRACQTNKPIIDDLLDAHEISLFESPEKKDSWDEEGLECSPSKKIKKSLFIEEFEWSPCKVASVKEPGLEHRKSYGSKNSPHDVQYRGYLRKVKKSAAESSEQKKRKTKQDILIDSLNKHFSEFDDMDLCIE